MLCGVKSHAAGPLPPNEAASHMTLPSGFSATLFAGEPDIVQPIAFTFDDRGRVWVAECLTYPQWDKSGSLTGHDRIVILEDTTNSGHFDRKTVFADNLVNLTGLEIGFGGVFVCSSPRLLFIPADNLNGDAPRPSGPPRVLLDGWNIKDCQHNVFNRLTWAPDGWLWGLNGILSPSHVGVPGTPETQRKFLDCGVWRYQPTTHAFEVVAHGTTNPWGLDFDDWGQAFITNCVINHLWHVIPGGHYERMSGHGADASSYIYATMNPCADHLHFIGKWTDVRSGPNKNMDAGGGHAHVGAMVYLGDNWPDSYRNSIFMCNLHGHRVNHDLLVQQGSGYVGHHGSDFLLANDDWFRGLNLAYGPDGSVFLSDWCDTGECHNHIEVDRSNGRLFKITYGKTTPVQPNLASLSDMELVHLQLHKNDWFVRHARRLLQERFVAGKLDPAARAALSAMLQDDPDVTRKLRAIWTLNVTGGLEAAQQHGLLASPEEYLRNWGVRLALEQATPDASMLDALAALARTDPSPVVRVALASGLQRLPTDKRDPIIAGLIRHPEDAKDANLPLMIWYGIAPTLGTDANRGADLIAAAEIPLVRQYITRFLATPVDSDISPLIALLSLAREHSASRDLDVLRGLLEAFQGRPKVAMPPSWPKAYANLSQSADGELRRTATQVAVVFGDEVAFAQLRKTAADTARAAEERESALRSLVEARDAQSISLMEHLLDEPAMRSEAIKSLAESNDPATAELLLGRYSSFTDDQKHDAVTALASRSSSALALLKAIGEKLVPRTDLSPYNLRQLDGLKDATVDKQLLAVWGSHRASDQTKTQTIASMKATLTPELLRQANQEKGRTIFARTCAACHTLFDAGGKVGPNLTGAQRSNLDYLLLNIVDPSAIVARDYLLTTLRTKDGRLIDGIIVEDNANAVTLRTPTGDTRIPRNEIDRLKTSNLSMMPEGLLEALKPEELRDLIAYLQSPKQVPLPSAP
jgi:putative membrane-bound dehydrogenase-like protein